jgi:transcriptional regulator with XRE-family HTH domain
MAGKRYTEKDKEMALAQMIANINPDTGHPNWLQLEKKTGISRQTLEKWYKNENEKDPDRITQLRAQKKEEFVNMAWKIISKAMPKILDDIDSDNTKPKDRATIVAILFDKQALAMGEPTSMFKGDININAKEQLLSRINSIITRKRKKRDNQ